MKTGKVDEFSAFAEASLPSLMRLAWMLNRDRQRAEDLTQEALVKIWLAWRKREIGNPMAYARTVLIRCSIDERRRRSSGEVPTEIPDFAGGSTEDAHITSLTLRNALQHLGATDRAIVVLRFYVGLSSEEIAQEVGLTSGAVRTRLTRATSQLRTQLGSAYTP